MKIDKEQLHKLYMDWVHQVAEQHDWKTTFGPKEIVYSIAHILETNPNLINHNDPNIPTDNN